MAEESLSGVWTAQQRRAAEGQPDFYFQIFRFSVFSFQFSEAEDLVNLLLLYIVDDFVTHICIERGQYNYNQ